MSLDPRSKIDPEEDTVFEEETQDTPMEASSSPGLTSKTSAGEAKVVMDSASLELLKGSTIDYTVELIGSQFKVVNNPRATSSCGCGTSFDVTEG
nr:iron-sulfur cluster assembly accessory protein [Coccidioides posadasii RMSCC 3488]